jgi:hypothetical protein
MSLTTRYPGKQIIIANSPENIVMGTVMLGNLYGEVISASVVRDGDIEELEAAGSILACIIRNPSFQFKFETTFRLDVVPPGFAELITFPLAGIKGRVLPPITVKWEEKGHRGLSIEAKSWDQFSGTNQGGGNAYTFDGASYTAIVDP